MTEESGLQLAFLFAVLLNWIMTIVHRRTGNQGFTLLWVIVGCLGVLIIAALVPDSDSNKLALYWAGKPIKLSNHAHASFYELKFFVFAGIPMVLGVLWRKVFPNPPKTK